MNAIQAVQSVRTLQYAFLTITTLQLTAHYWPKDTKLEDGLSFDFIVVGAGTAGSVVATRLVEEDTKTVLLIEAGSDAPLESELPMLFPFLKDSRHDWNLTSEDDGVTAQYHQHRKLFLSQGRMLGGSSSLNHLVYNRGSPNDYDLWAKVAKDSSWKYQNLLPFFKKSERLEDEKLLKSNYRQNHGTRGNIGTNKQSNPTSQSYVKSFLELGHKFIQDTSGYLLGFGEPLFTISEGVRQSTAYAYLRLVKECPNLYLARNTQATKIVFDENDAAVGVKVITPDGKTVLVHAKNEVIISAGAFNSAKLLMLSGIGPKEQLRKHRITCRANLPVGKNLQDHAGVVMLFKMGKTKAPESPNPHKFPLQSVFGYVALNKTQTFPDYQGMSFIFHDSNMLIQICSFVFKFSDNICNNFYKSSIGREMFFGIPNDLHPRSRGEVLLRSKDAKDPPIIKTGHFSDEEDLGRIVKFLKDYYRVIKTSYFRKSDAELVRYSMPNCKGATFESDEYWSCFARNNVISLFHFSGTCAMGSVVDSKLKVRGVKSLRVIDASIMPYIPGGTTYAATVMIGEKGAEMIKEEHYYWKGNKRN